MKYKSGVALECERLIDIMHPSLIWVGSSTLIYIYSKRRTVEVGSSLFKMSERWIHLLI